MITFASGDPVDVMGSRRTEIKRHLPEEEIDETLRETEDNHYLRSIGFIKNLYQGDTIPEAADRECRSAATGTRWAEDWNEGGFEELVPSFGGGRPPKLDEDEQPHNKREGEDLVADGIELSSMPSA
jgi:hypothetical protein